MLVHFYGIEERENKKPKIATNQYFNFSKNVNKSFYRYTYMLLIEGPPYFFFFEKCFKKSTFIFYLKVQSFQLIMENNFIQMDASAGHAVAYTIGPIFKYIIDCVQLYFTNGFTNIVL